ncbi:MAG TPA: hypothetical protein VI408_08605 [Gaiellaceae bacterium]
MHAMLWRSRLLALAAAALTAAVASGTARADDPPTCPSSTQDAYGMSALALTGPSATDLTLTFDAKPGCGAVVLVKHIQVKTFTADGAVAAVKNVKNEEAKDGVAAIALDRVDRGLRIETDAEVQTGEPTRTFVLRDATTSKLRPDLVVTAIDAPKSVLVGTDVSLTANIEELNGDVGATATATLKGALGPIGDPMPLTVAADGSTTVTLPAGTLATATPNEFTIEVSQSKPAEYDVTNDTRSATVEVTKSELKSPPLILFPSLVGYGAQFNHHLYAPVTQKKMPPGGTQDVEQKVEQLEPQLVRIFYNDNWEENIDGKHPSPEFEQNYQSFVRVVELAQNAGATILISYQNLANLNSGKNPYAKAMAKFADVFYDLVVTHGLTNVRWAEVGNEPNSGLTTLDQYKRYYQALSDELVARALRDHVKLMGGGLVENGVGPRDHYEWLKWIGANMGDLVDAYAEHVYWWYDRPGRLEYRMRDIEHLAKVELPEAQQKPMYMMEFGIRGDNACGSKPNATNTYYGADAANCPEIWRTNLAGFQQFWFNVHSGQFGVPGTSKWDAYWAIYDNTLNPPQVYWMTGPASEGYPLTPTYNVMSMLFHTTVPGWQIIRVLPWQSNDESVPDDPGFHASNGQVSSDTPEQELAAYAGPTGELTVVGLDTNGRFLNGVSPDPPSEYSIGNLPANSAFSLVVWNATGDGTNSIAGTVTTNAAGVARFEVPLQAAFALTNVPVE